jgi:hypothetical protein
VKRLLGLIPSVAAAGLLAGCLGLFDSQKVAGNGSEVENAVAVGRVTFLDGSSAPGASVTAYPSDYDAMAEPPIDPAFTAATDTGGHWELHLPPGSNFNLWIHRRADGLRALTQDVHTEAKGSKDAGLATLMAPGRLRITLPEGSGEGGYVYVPGTPLAKAVDGSADSNGTLLLDSIPPGRLKTVLLGRKGKAGAPRVLGTNVLIKPGETTLLPFAAWASGAAVRVNASGIIAKPVARMPLLLRLTAADLDFAQAKGDGSDVRFSRENGTILPCRVQSWDSAAGTASVWIKVDTVAADTAAQRLRMFWGNPRATPESNPGAVFDTADGFVGAWHLDAAPAGAVPAFADATPAGNAAKAIGAAAKPDSPVSGPIGGGVSLNGSDAWLMSSREYPGPTSFTASFWFRTTTTAGGKMLGFVMPGLKGVTYGSKTGNFNFDRVIWMTDDGLLHAGFTMRSTSYPTILGAWQSFTAAKPYNDGEWHQVAYTLWDRGILFMVDGSAVASYGAPVRSLPDAGHWRVGYVGEGKWDPEWTSEYFRGSVDEVRLIHQTRSEDWLRLDYESQKPGSTLLQIERNPAAAPR